MNKTIAITAAILIIGFALYSFNANAKKVSLPDTKKTGDENEDSPTSSNNTVNKKPEPPPTRKPQLPQINENLSRYRTSIGGDEFSSAPNFVDFNTPVTLFVKATSQKDDKIDFLWSINGVSTTQNVTTIVAEQTSEYITYKSQITLNIIEPTTISVNVIGEAGNVSGGTVKYVANPRQNNTGGVNIIYPSIQLSMTEIPVSVRGAYQIPAGFFVELANENEVLKAQAPFNISTPDPYELGNKVVDFLNDAFRDKYKANLTTINTTPKFDILFDIVSITPDKKMNIKSIEASPKTDTTPKVTFLNKKDNASSNVVNINLGTGSATESNVFSADGIKYHG